MPFEMYFAESLKFFADNYLAKNGILLFFSGTQLFMITLYISPHSKGFSVFIIQAIWKRNIFESASRRTLHMIPVMDLDLFQM